HLGDHVGAQGAPGANVVTKVLSADRSRDALEAILERAKADVAAMLEANRHLVEALRDALLAGDELVGDQILEVIAGAGRAGDGELVLDLDLLARGPAALVGDDPASPE
ncbi:MAG TPA: hypothetical protein VM263_01345, partial [Acidimicrobiales bacterium]|nr:hypothetical protein [Acidimicrobiales bacterium]